MTDIFNLRHDFTLKSLDERDALSNPIVFFAQWLNDAIEAQALEPNAMNLATATKDGIPSSRVVLLKEIKHNGFIFFTNYESRKAQQLAENDHCALTFSWYELERQVRIEGIAQKITPAESDAYFEMRPAKSKLGAWASPQSRIIPNREYLEKLNADFESKFGNRNIPRPENWGGYLVIPHSIEFWQGRASRLHDRLRYIYEDDMWRMERLAP